MSSLKPITVWSQAGGPNPWKVVIILHELGVPHQDKVLANGKHKGESYLRLNPNGRVPTIEDPNTGITLWETGAIIPYLIDTYDRDNTISYPSGELKWKQLQWLAFPAWFTFLHPEKLSSAIERYQDEIVRVNGVLDRHLQQNEWLVGDKCTYADLAFINWANATATLDGGKSGGKYPAYEKWLARLMERPAVKKTYADQDEAKRGTWDV